MNAVIRIFGPSIGLLFLSGLAQACQICVPYPKQSVADDVLANDVVVLAREDAERPFHYRSIEVLKGQLEEPAIDLFLDSATRRTLAVYPERSVVLVGRSEGNRLTWQRVCIANAETERVVRSILQSAAIWSEDPRSRVDFFASYLDHDNERIRSLAHLEVGRSPYSVIRTLGDALPPNEIRAFLGDIRYMEWHALYILLLAGSGDARDHAYIEASLRDAAHFGTSHRLAAWATAWIELSGEEALDFLRDEYFEDQNRKPEELKAVVQAMSVHGTGGHMHLRDRIVTAYQRLLRTHPAMTPNVVPDAIAWKRTEFTDAIESFLYQNPGAFCVKVADSLPCSCEDEVKTP